MNLQVGDFQLLAESRHFVKLASSSNNALGECINIAAATGTGAERRVDDNSNLNDVEGAAAFLEGAMVVADSQMLGRIDKVVDIRTTETAGRHDAPHPEHVELLVIQIVRGDRGIGVGVGPFWDESDFCGFAVYFVSLGGRDELAVRVLDNENVKVLLACEDSRNRSLALPVNHYLGV
jgi:hypothetical protein